MKHIKRCITLLLCCILLAGLLAGCHTQPEKNYNSMADLQQARIGVLTGSAHELTAKRHFPDAERIYFNTMADMVLSLEQGKIDCYLEDEPFLVALMWEGTNVRRLEDSPGQMNNGFAFPQTEESRPLREQMNAFLVQTLADGTIERLMDKWIAGEEPTEHPDPSVLTGENGTIRVAVSVDNKPLLYQYEGECTGFEIELLTLFGQTYGYAFEFEVLPFESIIAGIAAGKYDMASSALNITPEREESVDFSDPYTQFDVVLVVWDEENAGQQRIHSLQELETGTIAILTGSFYDGIVREQFPNAEIKYYSSHADMIVSLEQGKIDAIVEDKTIYTTMRWENAPVTALNEPIATNNTGLIFSLEDHDPQLLSQINVFIAKSRADGTIDALLEKWISDQEPSEHPDYTSLTGENGTLKVAVGTSMKPMSYMKNDAYTGFEVDLLTLFAREYGYRLQFEGMAFDALIPSVSTGKCDIGAAGISITPERAQSVTFSDSHMATDGVAIVYQETDASAQTRFFDDVKESFEKTFIRENRWKLILEGVGVTMFISLCSAVAGTLLGFGLYMLSRSQILPVQKLSVTVARVYSRIIAGTPVVVILMILFYVVFGSIRDISGVLVAIIGFTLTFGSFVYDHMTVSVGSVDRGQWEAAYALGYTRNQTFFRIILPQAMTIFLPSYCGQAVELIKATAVVGYVAVNDLTKMGDIIRSNTYEAFFPLISTAVIYFLLTWILASLLNLVKIRFEPKRRKKEDILKGVKTV